MGDIRTSARVTVHTFKRTCSLPLVHRPKRVLLVIIAFGIHLRSGGYFECCDTRRMIWNKPFTEVACQVMHFHQRPEQVMLYT